MNDFVSPAVQAMNLIREIGDKVSQSNEPLNQLTPRNKLEEQLIVELVESGIIKIPHDIDALGDTILLGVNLTLAGWEQYEAEKRGKFEGGYGFIAMKFNDPELDPFVKDVVKPVVKDGIGYDLVDMRDVSEAGIINNLMRVRIRDSAFVIADLTHDNLGAYWEAGYAEGLGKPVVYICEKTKLGGKGGNRPPHVDASHCTTVPWSKDDLKGKEFGENLVATLRRSLDLPPTGT